MGHRRRALQVGATVLLVGLAAGLPAAASADPSGATRRVLPQAAPRLPVGTTVLGSAPSAQVLHLDVVLAGRDPAGLDQAVAAVSTPGSPGYRHYLTPAQYAEVYGPTPQEILTVATQLRTQGLSVGAPANGSDLLPVSGTAAAVSAVFATPLDSVRTPDHRSAVVNTGSPSVASALGGAVTGVVGLDGTFSEHAMALNGRGVAAGSSAGGQTAAAVAHAGTPQACPAAQNVATGGTYTSSELAGVFGLDQVFAQGRTGAGQTMALVEFEQYLPSDFAAFEACFGLNNSIRNVAVDGGPGGPPEGSGEAALDTEMAAANAPSASLVVYEAPNSASDASAVDLFQQIATDDAAKVVTTSWGDCESLIPQADLQGEHTVFAQMALQGQTVVAASGDAGSEDCYPNSPHSTSLAVDDPGSQPDVVSVGGTHLPSANASTQSVWNQCQGQLAASSAVRSLAGGSVGATGGGYSTLWPRNQGQPAPSGFPGGGTDPCNDVSQGCREVPDVAYPSDPSAGSVVAYFSGNLGGWTAFGGTSVAAPSTAGYLADVNQGCASTLGAVGPALYAAPPSSFTDITSGDNDFTSANGGLFGAGAGYDAATGLGTPVDQNLLASLQGGGGCPSIAGLSPDSGPIGGGGAVTITGGGLADATSVSFGAAGQAQIVMRQSGSLTVVPPAAPGRMCVVVTVTSPLGTSVDIPAADYGYGGDLACGRGYRFAASDGGIFDFGSAGFYGSTGNLVLNRPVVGTASTASTNGYWLVASDGGIFAFGDASFDGSMGGRHLNQPIVGMAATPDGAGYWLVATDGGIFSFGDASFHGSTGGIHLNRPIVGLASTPDGAGYWLVASDGGIFAFGDASFHGSTGGLHLNQPIVGMAATPDGAGYWLVASDGGIFTFGDASFHGSTGGIHLNRPVVGMAATPDGAGYWLVASDGGVFTYGDASFFGSTGALALNKPIVAVSGT